MQKFKLKLSTSLVDEIMNVFEGPNKTVDQELLKSFYLEEYPETTAAPLKLRKKKLRFANRQEKTEKVEQNDNTNETIKMQETKLM